MIRSSDIHIRDPFILPVKEEGRYYLYGTTGADTWSGPGKGFNGYTSTDLENWEGPFPVFRPTPDFWGKINFWAPEVHHHQGKYYMFASFKAEGKRRATHILCAGAPLGPFLPLRPEPITPSEWECLDGTLLVEQGQPWIVFCHEWVQVHDGEMCALALTSDLKAPASEPHLLFRASQAPWVMAHQPGDYVTDGPFFYRALNGELLLLWSSFGAQGYALGIARSESGTIQGPWRQDPEPLFAKDGGHGMLFRTFTGKLMLTLHTPNQTPNERPAFFEVIEESGQLSCAKMRSE
jgi:arabinan endo-1,5-alpha-L-arabinosidase